MVKLNKPYLIRKLRYLRFLRIPDNPKFLLKPLLYIILGASQDYYDFFLNKTGLLILFILN